MTGVEAESCPAVLPDPAGGRALPVPAAGRLPPVSALSVQSGVEWSADASGWR